MDAYLSPSNCTPVVELSSTRYSLSVSLIGRFRLFWKTYHDTASAVTLPRPEAAGRDAAAVKSRGAVSEDMSLAGGKAKKCLNNMTIFNQENVEEFYEIGNELGR